MATVDDVRELFEAKVNDCSPAPNFHPLDLERLKNDKYIERVLLHSDKKPKQAADMLWNILTWRKTVGANDINESNIRIDYIKEGIFFPRGRDVDGYLLFIFKSKLHVKGRRDYEELKKIIIYWFDRIEREENGKPITMFFDMDGCGLGNMDMELIKYLINLFDCYYPYFLNYIVIYQLPWVLSAAFKVVKTILPAKAVEILKFLTKDNLKEIVPPDQALTCWGGKDNYVFEFVPEIKSPSHSSSKKVTFAEQGDTRHSPGEMLHLFPNDVIVFKNENDEISGQFTITNMHDSAISFKIRTTAPDKFRVRPSSGVLDSGVSQTVLIVVQPAMQSSTISKDRFLVMSIQIPKTDLTPIELADIWQSSTSSKTDEYRLKCQYFDKDGLKNGTVLSLKSPDREETVAHSLSYLEYNYELLQRDLQKLKWMQYVTLSITVLIAIIGYFIYINIIEGGKYCQRM